MTPRPGQLVQGPAWPGPRLGLPAASVTLPQGISRSEPGRGTARGGAVVGVARRLPSPTTPSPGRLHPTRKRRLLSPANDGSSRSPLQGGDCSHLSCQQCGSHQGGARLGCWAGGTGQASTGRQPCAPRIVLSGFWREGGVPAPAGASWVLGGGGHPLEEPWGGEGLRLHCLSPGLLCPVSG